MMRGMEQAKRFAAEIAGGVKGASDVRKQLVLASLRQEIEAMVPLVRQVMKQTRARIFRGDTRSEGNPRSSRGLFEPSTEIIRKGKASKPTEFGKMVKLQEAENQIVTAYEVYGRRPADSDLLIGAIRHSCGTARPHAAPGGGRRRLLLREEREGGESQGRQARVHSQPLDQKSRAQARAKEALVPQRPEMAHRMRGPHQRDQAPARPQPLPLQGRGRNEAMGRPRRDRRQCHQYRPRPGKTRHQKLRPPIDPRAPPVRPPPATPAGFAFAPTHRPRRQNIIFAPESS